MNNEKDDYKYYMYSDYESGLIQDNEYTYKVRDTWEGLRTYEGKLVGKERTKRELERLKYDDRMQ